MQSEVETRNQIRMRVFEPAATTPSKFARHIRADIDRWIKVTRAAAIRAQ